MLTAKERLYLNALARTYVTPRQTTIISSARSRNWLARLEIQGEVARVLAGWAGPDDQTERQIVTEQRIEKAELVTRVAARVQVDAGAVEEIVDATLEEIYQALKRGESVSLRNFGTFYVREERSSRVFRFNPSQKWRALFSWSSTYKGEL